MLHHQGVSAESRWNLSVAPEVPVVLFREHSTTDLISIVLIESIDYGRVNQRFRILGKYVVLGCIRGFHAPLCVNAGRKPYIAPCAPAAGNCCPGY